MWHLANRATGLESGSSRQLLIPVKCMNEWTTCSSLFHNWKSQGLEWWNHFFRVTQVISGTGRSRTHICLIPLHQVHPLSLSWTVLRVTSLLVEDGPRPLPIIDIFLLHYSSNTKLNRAREEENEVPPDRQNGSYQVRCLYGYKGFQDTRLNQKRLWSH